MGLDVANSQHANFVTAGETAMMLKEHFIERYGEVQSRFEELDGYGLESRAREVLAGLSFSEEMMDAVDKADAAQFTLDLLNARQAGLQLRRQRLQQLERICSKPQRRRRSPCQPICIHGPVNGAGCQWRSITRRFYIAGRSGVQRTATAIPA